MSTQIWKFHSSIWLESMKTSSQERIAPFKQQRRVLSSQHVAGRGFALFEIINEISHSVSGPLIIHKALHGRICESRHSKKLKSSD